MTTRRIRRTCCCRVQNVLTAWWPYRNEIVTKWKRVFHRGPGITTGKSYWNEPLHWFESCIVPALCHTLQGCDAQCIYLISPVISPFSRATVPLLRYAPLTWQRYGGSGTGYSPLCRICVAQLGHHWFRSWLVAWSVPSHDLNQ